MPTAPYSDVVVISVHIGSTKVAVGLVPDGKIPYSSPHRDGVRGTLPPVLGRGVATMPTPFLDELYGRTTRYCVTSRRRKIQLLSAYFRVDAGVAGCVAFCSGEAALASDGLIFSSGTAPVPSSTP